MPLPPIVSLILTVASSAYQIYKQNKMKKEMEEQIDKTRGFVVNKRFETASIPVCYGHNAIGGIETRHILSNRRTLYNTTSVANYFGITEADYTSTYDNVFHNSDKSIVGGDQGKRGQWTYKKYDDKRALTIAYAICHDGIEGVQWVRVNDADYNDRNAKFWHIIQTYNEGQDKPGRVGAAPYPLQYAGNNALKYVDTSQDLFTGMAHAVASFHLNREEPQYSGIPNVTFILKGRKVRYITESGTDPDFTYTLSTEYVYSQNPAYCLLDYLLNDTFGVGLSEDEVDLESFYLAADVCDTVVHEHQPLGGRINGNKRITTVSTYANLPSNLEKKRYPNDVWRVTSDPDTTKNGYWEWQKIAKKQFDWRRSYYKPGAADPIEADGLPFAATIKDFTDPSPVVQPVSGAGAFSGFFNISANVLNEDNLPIDSPEESVNYVWFVNGKYYRGTLGYGLRLANVARETNSGWVLRGEYTAYQGTTPPSVADPLYEYSESEKGDIYWSGNGSEGYKVVSLIDWVQVEEPETNLVTLPLYECNVTLDTEKPKRDNINVLLNTMGEAKLIWDAQGRYKLQLFYPQTQEEMESLVSHVFTEDNIIRKDVTIDFGRAEDRLNQVTVDFLNEELDFKEDSKTWPKLGSTPHLQYLAEDNGRLFQTTVQGTGITNPYHAEALAEQLVRFSRSAFTVKFTADKTGMTVEPGDFIKINSENLGLNDEVLQVLETKIYDDITIDITAYRYDYTALAYNVDDGVAYTRTPTKNYTVDAVQGLTFTKGAQESKDTALGVLSWDAFDNGMRYRAYWKALNDENYQLLGETSTNSLPIFELNVDNYALVDFKVVGVTPLGSTGAPAYLLEQEVIISPEPPQNLVGTEEQYVSTRGLKTRMNLSWDAPSSGLSVGSYVVRYKKSTDVEYKTAGTTNLTEMVVDDLTSDQYSFEVASVSSGRNTVGEFVEISKTVVGFSAVPADPTGFTGNVSDGQVTLSWDLPTELDVFHGGYVEIRYHPNTNGSESWDTASPIVTSLSGNTNNKTVPAIVGSYFIKIYDAFDNVSVNSAKFVNLVGDTTFGIVDVIDEKSTGFLGSKTNCTVINNNLEISPGQNFMTYLFDDIIDLQEITSVRLRPNIIAAVTDTGTTVADYVNIANLASFAGPLKNATIKIFVSTTNDDPLSSPTWTPYSLLTVGNFQARAFRFKLEITTADSTTDVIVSELGITADRRNRSERGTSTSSSSADTLVTFDTPFYGGVTGTDVPSIGIAIIGGSSGDNVVITSKTKTGFSYSVYHSNGSNRLVRNIDYQAIGL